MKKYKNMKRMIIFLMCIALSALSGLYRKHSRNICQDDVKNRHSDIRLRLRFFACRIFDTKQLSSRSNDAHLSLSDTSDICRYLPCRKVIQKFLKNIQIEIFQKACKRHNYLNNNVLCIDI